MFYGDNSLNLNTSKSIINIVPHLLQHVMEEIKPKAFQKASYAEMCLKSFSMCNVFFLFFLQNNMRSTT